MPSLFHPLESPYAETHFKFKLPWSPLYKRWPEIFIDGPSFCLPGAPARFYLVIKDGDFFPVTIKEVEVLIQGGGGMRKQSFPLSRAILGNLEFLPLLLDVSGLSGALSINARITVEKKNGATRVFLNANFPGLSPSPLLLRLLSSPLPYPPDWHAGEMHCHSDYSNDPVEFGAPLAMLQEAGESLGLGFVLCTDHSYDFYYQKTRYMQPTEPGENFQAYRREALALNASAPTLSLPLLIPGEEVSCGNHLGENVHLLVAGHEEFLPGLGDGGRRWFNNRPDLKVGEVLERLGSTPCFAAHPRVQVGMLEKWIFRRGMWHEVDVQPQGGGRGIDGLQFWNGHRGRDFGQGRSFWVKQLLAGKRLSPIGANDAHGDLNRNIGVKTPLFSLYQARSHVFGNVRTVVRAKEKSIAAIQAGLKAGDLFCTDGPFLSLTREGDAFLLHARSSDDFGGLEKVQIVAGRSGDSREIPVKEWNWESDGPLEVSERLDCPAGVSYLRAEVRTAGKRFAMTGPIQ